MKAVILCLCGYYDEIVAEEVGEPGLVDCLQGLGVRLLQGVHFAGPRLRGLVADDNINFQ